MKMTKQWKVWSMGLSLLAASVSAQALEVGQAVPAVNVMSLSGGEQALNPTAKVTYVDFWASWCGPCKQSFPWMNDMQAKYGKKGLEILAVNVDAKASDAEKFLASNPAQFKVVQDIKGAAAKAYGVKGMPSSYLIVQGKVIATHQGFKETDREELEKAIQGALNGQ